LISTSLNKFSIKIYHTAYCTKNLIKNDVLDVGGFFYKILIKDKNMFNLGQNQSETEFKTVGVCCCKCAVSIVVTIG
jgi:hypothetical protein